MDGYNPLSSMTANAQTLAMSKDRSIEAYVLPVRPAEVPPVFISENITSKNIEHGSIKKQVLAQSQKRVGWASILLALFGLNLIEVSLLINSGPVVSTVLEFSGVSIVLIAILLYFVTPSRLVRSEVSDASSISNIKLVSNLLSPMLGEERGIYVPSSRVGITQVFIKARDREICKAFSGSEIIFVSDSGRSGIFMTPPGYGLYSHARSMGASFTDDGLEDEIEDVMVNGMELAPRVEVKRSDDHIFVRIYGLAESPICKSMRQKGMKACMQAGCPVCSFIASMIVEGTGKYAMVHDAVTNGNAMDLTYTLF